jgi:hypothetical protein
MTKRGDGIKSENVLSLVYHFKNDCIGEAQTCPYILASHYFSTYLPCFLSQIFSLIVGLVRN